MYVRKWIPSPLLFLLLTSGTSLAFSQAVNPSIIPVAVAPAGSCSSGLPNQQVISTGVQYSCQNGTWGAIGGGSGSGTVNSGQANQLAYYAGSGTTVSGTNTIPAENATQFTYGDGSYQNSAYGTGAYGASGLRSFGDSNTSGFGAVANSGTYAGPLCASNNALCSYVAIMAPAFGSSQTSGTGSQGSAPNYGKAGAFAEDETYTMLKTISGQHYYNGQTWTAMIGTNNSGTTTGLQTNFTLINTAGYVYASTPIEDMIFPGTNTTSVSTTGTWTQDSSFQTNMGLATQASGTLTFTTFIASKALVIAINGANSNTSSATFSCDSGAVTGTLTTAGAATLNFSGGDTYTALGYLETFTNNATHSCTLTITASAGNPFTVQYIAVPPTASEIYSPTTVNLPRGFILGTPYYQNNTGINATFDTLQRNLHTALNAAGWTNIGFVDTRACVNSTTDMSSVDYTLANGLTYPASASPGAHIDNQGYEKLAACVIATAQPVAAGSISTLATVQNLINSGGASWYDWSPMWGANWSGTNLASPLNATTAIGFTVPTTSTYSKITYYVYAADNTGDLYDIGWYDSTGNLLCHVGATAGTTFAPTTGFITLPMTGANCSFTAGKKYFFAFTGNATTMKYQTPSNLEVLSRVAAAAGGTTTGGVLNGSITPLTDSYQYINAVPEFVMHN